MALSCLFPAFSDLDIFSDRARISALSSVMAEENVFFVSAAIFIMSVRVSGWSGVAVSPYGFLISQLSLHWNPLLHAAALSCPRLRFKDVRDALCPRDGWWAAGPSVVVGESAHFTAVKCWQAHKIRWFGRAPLSCFHPCCVPSHSPYLHGYSFPIAVISHF